MPSAAAVLREGVEVPELTERQPEERQRLGVHESPAWRRWEHLHAIVVGRYRARCAGPRETPTGRRRLAGGAIGPAA